MGFYKIINRKKRIIVCLIDIFGFLLFAPINILSLKKRGKKGIEKKKVKKILLVRLAYVGDVIMTLPVLKPLKKMFPEASIFFLTGTREAEILENNPIVDSVITYDAFWFYPKPVRAVVLDYLNIIKKLRNERFDLAIDFRGDIRNILFILFLSSAAYRVSYGIGGGGYLLTHITPFKRISHKISYHLDILRSLGCDCDISVPKIYLSTSDRHFREKVFKDHGISAQDLVIGIHPGGRKRLKCWYPESYIQVTERLTKDFPVKVFITGSFEDIETGELIKAKHRDVISLCGKTSLKGLASLISGFDLFITGDSAPMHIASALGTPVIAIFGPSESRQTGPYGKISRVIEKDFPCRFTCDEDKCHNKDYHGCMKAITSTDVLNAVKEIVEDILDKTIKIKNL